MTLVYSFNVSDTSTVRISQPPGICLSWPTQTTKPPSSICLACLLFHSPSINQLLRTLEAWKLLLSQTCHVFDTLAYTQTSVLLFLFVSPMAMAAYTVNLGSSGVVFSARSPPTVMTPYFRGSPFYFRLRGFESRNCSRLSCSIINNSAGTRVPFLQEEKVIDQIPTPIVVIDQDSDPAATVVEITFGDRLGALLDTMKALRDLGLNVVKGTVSTDSSGIHNKFFITQVGTGRKVENPELLEAIRLTIIVNLLKYHPESSIQLAMGEAFGIMPPTEKPDVDIATHINIYDDGPKRSLLCIETADRPGLLMEVVKAIADISVSVESGEFDTEGLLAKAKFHVSYHGSALSKSLKEVLTNSLLYFLRRPSTEESSF